MAESSPKRALKTAGDYRYLPLECPNCGFSGKVKIARLDQTFHCKQCRKVFHVTRDGTATGERPAEKAERDPAEMVLEEKPSWLDRWFGKLPPAGRWAVLGLAALGLAFAASRLMEPGEPLPGELEDRAELAAKSFASGDWSTLKRLAKSRTAGALGKWYDKNRPAAWNDATGEIRWKTVAVKKGLLRYEKTTPILDARITVEMGPAAKPASQVIFLWEETEFGEWWLDGERMFKESRVTPSKTASPQTDPSGEKSSDQSPRTVLIQI